MEPIRWRERVPGWRRLAVLAALAAMVAFSWLGVLESAANAQVDAGLKRALISFASARGLNAVISLAQGTELAFQPAGIGLNVAVGQVLDPVNDLVEQFSNLMLAASVAFGVQKVLLAMGAHWLVSLLFTAVAVAWGFLFYRRQGEPVWLARFLVVLLMVRFAIPAVTLGSDAVFQHFLAGDYAASQQVIDTTAGQLDGMTPVPPAADANRGMLDKFKDWVGAQGTAWKDRLDTLKTAVERATEHIVKLMVIFLLQTLIVPLLLLWMLYGVARGAMSRRRR